MFSRFNQRVFSSSSRKFASSAPQRPARPNPWSWRSGAFVNRVAATSLGLAGGSLILFGVAHADEAGKDDFDFDTSPETMIYFPTVRHYLLERQEELRAKIKEQGTSEAPFTPGSGPKAVRYPEIERDGYEEAYAIVKDALTGATEQAKAWFKRLETPEIKEMIQIVREKKKSGQKSLHPWFPSDRTRLDQFWAYFRPEVQGLMLEPLIPDRIAMPFGKPLTVVIDASVLYSPEFGNRPGVDRFLSQVMQKYEIIIYADKIEDVKEIDPGRLVVTYHLARAVNQGVPSQFWKSARALNRPIENTLVIDTNPESVMHNPNNAIIVKPWDGFDLTDNTLPDLLGLLDYEAELAVERKRPIYELCPQFHHVDFDAVEVWRSKRAKLEAQLDELAK